MNNTTKLYAVFAIAIFCAMVLFLSKDLGFFWDNVLLCSKMGHYLYSNGLFSINIPNEFDPGHPPFMAFLQALGWKVFGKNLLTSHLIMMPFVFGFIWQLLIFISHFTINKIYQIVAICFCIADPTILSQFFLVAPEVLHLFLVLLAVNSILKENYLLKTIALFFLGIVTFRGMMLCGGVFVFEFFYIFFIKKEDKRSFAKANVISYVIGSSASLAYVLWRLNTKGWMQTHLGSQWEDLWHIVNFKEFRFNVMVLAHRYLDFGRVFVLVFIIFCFIKFRSKILDNQRNKILLLLAVSSTIIITIVSLLATNTIAHRYFAVSYLFTHLYCLSIIIEFFNRKFFIVATLGLLLITGNYWTYPHKIAQGWDASLKFIPYFGLRKEAINYLDKEQIKIEDVGSFFPNNFPIEEVSLNNDNRVFSDFSKDSKYIFYSNVYNLSNQEYLEIETNFVEMKMFRLNGIKVILYKNKHQ